AYRVQGHQQTRFPLTPRLTVADILKMPKGTRPKPKSPCWTCRDLNREPWHWRDECPNQRDQPPKQPTSFPCPQNNQRAPNAAQNRAQAPKPQGPRRQPPLGPATRGDNPRHRFRRQTGDTAAGPIAGATSP